MLDYLLTSSQFTNSVSPNCVYNIYNYASVLFFVGGFSSMHIHTSNIQVG